jgi:hypothetical protein
MGEECDGLAQLCGDLGLVRHFIHIIVPNGGLGLGVFGPECTPYFSDGKHAL